MAAKTNFVRSNLKFRLGTVPFGRVCAVGLPLSLALAVGASGCVSSASPGGKDADGQGPSAKDEPESGKDQGEGSKSSPAPSDKESPNEESPNQESPEEKSSEKDETPEEESSQGSSSKEQEPSKENSPEEDEPSGEASPEKEEPSEEENPSEDESSEKEEPSEEKTPEEEGPSEEDQDPNGRDCNKIDWGSNSEVATIGKVVGRSDSVGYLDRNKNGRIDDDELEETQVGLCQLHLTGKKCGYVIYGNTG